MRSKNGAIGLALQLAYEYENCGEEHVAAMIDTYTDSGEDPPCSYDELYGLMLKALKLRKEGKPYAQAEKELNRQASNSPRG